MFMRSATRTCARQSCASRIKPTASRNFRIQAGARAGAGRLEVFTPASHGSISRRSASTISPSHSRLYSSNTSPADAKIEEITELYATARDEFEIAAEETEKQTVYAEDDRAAAREELEKLKAVYQEAVTGSDKLLAEEVERRAGGRIRELENAVKAMEEMAMNQD
ncbi:hypothetical protein W97_01767 [Coniosporium apollinis CBS 100218]|uniref:Uncharacterized protein n=1 Tax=Coniosporium apollinis (strain CBS 100218) TaxID=1168221 RepID=R7YKY6_CONA1|nr:uncharacterized protein W97_01767 [Coniosporium apollinis CBS 100218]EON62543.1 hypothetical protein W97_01767 [Coniosporium apollinis CBS 100218]